MYVNKILFASTKPKKPVEVFNEFYVAKSLGAKEYNKHEFVRGKCIMIRDRHVAVFTRETIRRR